METGVTLFLEDKFQRGCTDAEKYFRVFWNSRVPASDSMCNFQGLLKHKRSMPQGSTENDAKTNFLENIESEYVLTSYS